MLNRHFYQRPIITDRLRSTMGRLCFDTCLSVCPQGVPRPGPNGGVPQPGPARGTRGRVPLAGMGYPPAFSGWGYLRWGIPWQGWGTPLQDRTADGLLDTPWSVRLLMI